jgi:tetratricopeptide (TPR) repeat protein
LSRRTESHTGETLLELQSFADSTAEWLRTNWIWPAGILLAVVVITGTIAGLRGWNEHSEVEAANAMAGVQREFLASMGAQPGTYAFEEPANPETGKGARRTAADKLLAVAKDHAGTEAAVQAQIEAGALLAQAGNGDQALEIWRGALAKGGISPALAALVQVRIAQVEESAGRWSEAAKAYQEAGEQREYPLWPWALADAARCLYEAGDRDQAVRIAERLRVDAPGAELPPHLSGLLDELRATGVTPKG